MEQPNLIENDFSTYDIPDDVLLKIKFDDMQIAVLKNDRTDIATKLLNLRPHGAVDGEAYFREHAYLSGQLEYVTTLIARFTISHEDQPLE